MPARGLLSSCATPDTSCPIADIFSDWMSCSCSIFWSVTSRMTHSTSSSSRGVEYVTWMVRTSPSLRDRKSTRLNSSHLVISYAVFCLKKKKKRHNIHVVVNEHV